MIKTKLILLIGALAMIFVGQAMAAEKIVNGIDANFPPFAFVDKTGKASGGDGG